MLFAICWAFTYVSLFVCECVANKCLHRLANIRNNKRRGKKKRNSHLKKKKKRGTFENGLMTQTRSAMQFDLDGCLPHAVRHTYDDEIQNMTMKAYMYDEFMDMQSRMRNHNQHTFTINCAIIFGLEHDDRCLIIQSTNKNSNGPQKVFHATCCYCSTGQLVILQSSFSLRVICHAIIVRLWPSNSPAFIDFRFWF